MRLDYSSIWLNIIYLLLQLICRPSQGSYYLLQLESEDSKRPQKSSSPIPGPRQETLLHPRQMAVQSFLKNSSNGAPTISEGIY